MKEIKLNNQTIELTSFDKILFPKSKITKGQVIEYYLKIADRMLPFLKDRPLTLNLYPHGIDRPGFYQQHASLNWPKWIKTIKLTKRNNEKMEHILCNDAASLIYLVNLNVITFHRWLSNINNPRQPDLMIMDIDPPVGKIDVAIKAAKIFREKLIKEGYSPQVISTGSKGFHLIDKPKRGLSFEDVKNFLNQLSYEIANEFPKDFTIEIKKEKREERVFLDTSRNAYGQTAIAPFSLRAIENAPFAHFIEWESLESYSKPLTINEV